MPEVEDMGHYFSGRTAKAISSPGLVDMEVKRGCPQGSVIGPYAGTLMRDVLKLVHMPTIYCCLLKGTQDDSLKEREGKSAADWEGSVAVAVSVDKTVMMLMMGTLSHTPTPSVRD